MSTTIIREARSSDLRAILDIYNEAVLHTTASYDETPQTFESRAEWFRARQQARLPVLVAARRDAPDQDTDVVLGWASFGPYRPKSGYRFTVEHSVYIAERARGEGLGRRLLTELVRQASDLGYHSMMASVDAGNAVSRRLHASLGFEEVGHVREIGFKFGQWLDIVYMRRLLDTPQERLSMLSRPLETNPY